MSSTGWFGIRCALLAATAAMFLLHLVTGVLLRRGVSGVRLLRFEAAYYVALLAAVALPPFRSAWVPALVLGALHLAGWLYAELRMSPAGAALDKRTIWAVQIFDWTEAAVLAWIGFTMAR